MTNALLKIIGAIYGTGWVGMYCWCFKEHFRSAPTNNSECEPNGSLLVSRFYDEGGGFGATSEEMPAAEQGAVVSERWTAIKTAA